MKLIVQKFLKSSLTTLLCLTILSMSSCSSSDNDTPEDPVVTDSTDDSDPVDPISYADINFSNWKVTLPVDENSNGSPDEYQPSELVNGAYRSNTAIQPFMYDDTSDQSLIFYCFPAVSTTNSSYSRTELRELINPNNSRSNWTLLEGGVMTGELKVVAISENLSSGDNYHKVIVMQIHGIISEEDMQTHGFSSNNGPPLIKIYWKDGYIWSHKKSLVNEATNGDDLLDTSSNTWYDIKENLGYVGFEAFNFKITASDARIEVQLNNNAPFIYEDISLDKWPFENYFKAGNYLTTTSASAFSRIKYYNLTVSH